MYKIKVIWKPFPTEWKLWGLRDSKDKAEQACKLAMNDENIRDLILDIKVESLLDEEK